jgi:hypothetical protein
LERLGIYSLGKTLQACHCLQPGGVLTDLLNKMTSLHSFDERNPHCQQNHLSLLHVLECVANQWKLLVGTSPISRFVAQLCKLTLGWTMSIPSVRSAVSVHSQAETGQCISNELNDISHIEFSKLLNDSSSSSRSTSPTSTKSDGSYPRPPQMPMSSSPILNNNNYDIQSILPPKLPPRKKIATVPAMPR